MEIKREHQINVLYFVAAFLAVMMIQSFFVKPDHIKTIAYSEFQQLVSQGKVTDLVIGPTQITGAFKDVTAKDVEAGKPQHFSTLRVEPGLAQDLAKANLVFSGQPSPGLLPTILGWLMPAIGFALVWMFLIRPMAMGGGAGGMMAIGKSKAKIYVEKDTKVTFADVAGVDEAKDELKEVVSFLKDPRSYGRLGAHVPKGVLLVGPPGTGKTLLARAVAGEAGVAFFSDLGLRVCRDVRWCRRGARARSF